MWRHFRSPLCLVAALFIFSFPAAATIHEGSISGTVVDSDGKQLAEATVTLFFAGGARSTVTGSYGRYLFTNVPPGDYPIQAEHQGFETVVREAVRVSPASETLADFSLAPEPDQTVTLTEDVALVDPVSRSHGATFSEAALTGVPRWQTYDAIIDDVPGVISVSSGERERLLFRSRGTAAIAARWYLDSFDVTTSDPRLSAAIASSLRNSSEIRLISGGTDPALATAGLNIVSVVPRRRAERSGSIFAHASDAALGGSSSVPGHLRDQLVAADSIDRSIEAGAGLGLPLIADTMWGWFSIGWRSVDGTESRESTETSADFQERSRALYMHFDSQWTPRYIASLALFHATRDDEGAGSFNGKASGLQLHESFLAGPRLFIQGSGSVATEAIRPFPDGDRWNLEGSGSWMPARLPGHELVAGIDGGESDRDPDRSDAERFSLYAGDTYRSGAVSVSASLRAESLQSAGQNSHELRPRAGLVWRPGDGTLQVHGGYSRYAFRSLLEEELVTVDEVFLGVEREIATGFLLSSRLVERDFDARHGATWRGLELGARRRLSSGLYLDGHATYVDSDGPDRFDPHWAYSLSAIVQVPMAGIGAGISIHGRDGFSSDEGRRLSDSWALDLRLSRQFGSRLPVTLSVDVLNATDERVLLLESGAERIYPEVQQPRAVRLGISAAF